MIYVYTFTKEEINYFCEDLLNFFPVSLQDSKIAVMALVELEDKIKDKILQKLFINSLCVSGLRRQYREKIDFNLPDFDYIFDFSFDKKNLEEIEKIALKHKIKLTIFAKAVKGKYRTDAKNHHF